MYDQSMVERGKSSNLSQADGPTPDIEMEQTRRTLIGLQVAALSSSGLATSSTRTEEPSATNRQLHFTSLFINNTSRLLSDTSYDYLDHRLNQSQSTTPSKWLQIFGESPSLITCSINESQHLELWIVSEEAL